MWSWCKSLEPLGSLSEEGASKLILNSKERAGEFGRLRPTLETPDIIIVVESEAKEGQETERKRSYLFVKTFIRYGTTVRHYESVTVSQDGKEIVISNHIIRPGQLVDRITKGSLLWSRYELSGTDTSGKNQGLGGQNMQVPNENVHGSNPQSSSVSNDKDNTNNSELQVKAEEKRKFMESLPDEISQGRKEEIYEVRKRALDSLQEIENERGSDEALNEAEAQIEQLLNKIEKSERKTNKYCGDKAFE